MTMATKLPTIQYLSTNMETMKSEPDPTESLTTEWTTTSDEQIGTTATTEYIVSVVPSTTTVEPMTALENKTQHATVMTEESTGTSKITKLASNQLSTEAESETTVYADNSTELLTSEMQTITEDASTTNRKTEQMPTTSEITVMEEQTTFAEGATTEAITQPGQKETSAEQPTKPMTQATGDPRVPEHTWTAAMKSTKMNTDIATATSTETTRTEELTPMAITTEHATASMIMAMGLTASSLPASFDMSKSNKVSTDTMSVEQLTETATATTPITTTTISSSSAAAAATTTALVQQEITKAIMAKTTVTTKAMTTTISTSTTSVTLAVQPATVTEQIAEAVMSTPNESFFPSELQPTAHEKLLPSNEALISQKDGATKTIEGQFVDDNTLTPLPAATAKQAAIPATSEPVSHAGSMVVGEKTIIIQPEPTVTLSAAVGQINNCNMTTPTESRNWNTTSNTEITEHWKPATEGVTDDTDDLLKLIGIDEENISIGDGVSISSSIQDAIPYMWEELDEKTRIQLGHQLRETIPLCTFDGEPCNYKEGFHVFNNPALGNCFTFNHMVPPKYQTYRAGQAHGLEILLSSSQSEYLCISQVAGFRVQIHNYTQFPFPEAEGFNVVPGQQSSISLTKTTIKRLQWPYTDCRAVDDTHDFLFNGTFTIEGCHKSCFQNFVLMACGCGDPRYPVPDRNIKCSLEQKQCVDNFRDCQSTLAEFGSCKCPNPCSDTMFSAVITAAQLKHTEALSQTCNSHLDDCSKENKNKNYALVEIFYERLNSIDHTESPAYTLYQLAADIGGILGIMLSISAISIVEFFYLSVGLITLFLEMESA